MRLHDAVSELAAAQDGLISTEQLRSLDISKWTQQRLAADGWLRRIVPRVYAIKGAPNTHHQRLRAGLLCLGERSWVAFESAATLHGLDRSNHRAVEFTVARGRRPPLLPFAVHTTTRLRPVDFVTVDGFRATSATRTIFDLALAGVPTSRIEAAIDSAVRLQLSSPEALRRRLTGLRGSGRGGCRLVEELITDSGGHTLLERRFLELVREAGLAAAASASGVPSGSASRRPSRFPLRRVRRGRRGVRGQGSLEPERASTRCSAKKRTPGPWTAGRPVHLG